MIQIRKILQNHLQNLCPRFYFQVAPDDAQPPYVTYDITAIPDDGEGLQVASIDIDGWDIVDDNDTTKLEDLMYAINVQTDKKTLRTDGMAMTLYLDRKMALTDTDPRVKRRRYVYQARIIGRS
ncbi:MAG: hypothetical protein WAP91_02460 [Bacilli bacterium]